MDAQQRPTTGLTRLLRLVLFALVCAAGMFLLASVILSHGYVSALTQPGCPVAQTEPLGLLGETTSVSFTTSDGIPLDGWQTSSQNGATIILLGGRGNRSSMMAEGAVLARHGYGLLLFDWRGCTASHDIAHTLGYQETLDVLAAAEYLKNDSETERIGVLGFSLGGAAAIRASAAQPAIGAVVAMGSYHDLEDEIREGGDDSSVLLRILGPEIAWLFQLETGVDLTVELEPVDVVGQIGPRPLLLIYGELEELQPPPSGRLLLEAAADPKELWIMPGVGHGGYLQARPAEFEQRVTSFFDSALLH